MVSTTVSIMAGITVTITAMLNQNNGKEIYGSKTAS